MHLWEAMGESDGHKGDDEGGQKPNVVACFCSLCILVC